MFEYYTVKESFCAEDAGTYAAYGIGVCEISPSSRKTLRYIPNVFLDRQRAEQLAETCNRLKLDPLHFLDVVQDAVSS